MKNIKLIDFICNEGLVDSRAQATGLIMAGKVIVNDQRIDKAGHLVGADDIVRIKSGCCGGGRAADVSRGRQKLRSAIDHFGLAGVFRQADVLDVGVSAGGFAQCSLDYGASLVTGVDVGTNQLDWRLRTHDQVVVHERTCITEWQGCGLYDVVLADISFNSLAKLLPAMVKYLKPKGVFIGLVKPQFELPRSMVPEGGVVTDVAHQQQAVTLVQGSLSQLGFGPARWCLSGLKGRKGNQEYFIVSQLG